MSDQPTPAGDPQAGGASAPLKRGPWQPATAADRPREELQGLLMQLLVFGGDLKTPDLTDKQKDMTFVLAQYGVNAGLLTPAAANTYLDACRGEVSVAAAVTFHGDQNDNWDATVAALPKE